MLVLSYATCFRLSHFHIPLKNPKALGLIKVKCIQFRSDSPRTSTMVGIPFVVNRTRPCQQTFLNIILYCSFCLFPLPSILALGMIFGSLFRPATLSQSVCLSVCQSVCLSVSLYLYLTLSLSLSHSHTHILLSLSLDNPPSPHTPPPPLFPQSSTSP